MNSSLLVFLFTVTAVSLLGLLFLAWSAEEAEAPERSETALGPESAAGDLQGAGRPEALEEPADRAAEETD